MDSSQTSLSEIPQSKLNNTGCAAAALIVLALFWLAPIFCVGQFSPLIASALPGSQAPMAGLISSIGRLILVAIPTSALAYAWRKSPEGAIARSWLKAIVFGAILLPLYLIPPIQTQLQTFLQVLIGGFYILVLYGVNFRRTRATTIKDVPDPAVSSKSVANFRIGWSGILGLIMLFPWLVYGALGSIIDTFLAASLAFVIASIVVLIHQTTTKPAFTALPEISSGTRFTYTGLTLAGLMAIVAGSLVYPFGTMQLLMLFCLPGLGWAAASLMLPTDSYQSHNAIGPLLLILLAAFGPLAFIDPDETTLVASASPGEILQYAFLAALFAFILSLVISLAATAAYFISDRRTDSLRPRILPVISWLLLVVILICGAAIYRFTGSPGRHGDTLFVILKDQANLTDEAQIADPLERREAVFNRLVQHSETTQAPLLEMLDRLSVGYTQYYLVNAIEIEDDLLARLWLGFQPEVDRILISQVMRPLPVNPPIPPEDPQSPPTAPLWNQSLINAERVWEEFGITGEGILIGQSDSGVDGAHPELASSFRGNDNQGDGWFDPWNNTVQPVDINGHGTHTLGTILGENVGVAPGAAWIACVNLARNLGNPALYLDCWQFNFAPFNSGGDPFTDGDPARGANIFNNSWGCPDLEGCDLHTFDAAAAALRTAGVFVVASAGNDGPTCGSLNVPPPTAQEVLSVGAINSNGDLAIFSSIGSGEITPDLVAPGVDVLSSTPGGSYGSNSGTSMAGPHAAGVVALMWSANPSLIGNIDLTEKILLDTTTPYTGSLPSCPGVEESPSTAFGYGILDAYAAVAESLRSR